MQSAVGIVRYGGFKANLHLALSLARNSVFVAANGARVSDPSVTKLIVIITDNVSANKSATLREAELIRDVGIGVVTIGVVTYLDRYELSAVASYRYELSAVASYPYTKNMFITNTATNLTVFTDRVKRIICGGPSYTFSIIPMLAVINDLLQLSITIQHLQSSVHLF